MTTEPPIRLAADSGTSRLGTFSYLPPLDEAALRLQIDHLVRLELEAAVEHSGDVSAQHRFWQMWRLPMFGERSPDNILAAVAACREANPGHVVRLVGYDRRRQTLGVAFLVA